MNEEFSTYKLKLRQALDLDNKILLSERRIHEAVKEFGEDGLYISFSGGKDSTVLLDLVRNLYPNIPAVFADTGLEYPEIREFVKTIDNVEWVKPKMTFKDVLKKYGYPVVGKNVSMALSRYSCTKDPIQKEYRLHGTKKGKYVGKVGVIPLKWQYLINAPFEVSEQCCTFIKKNPLKLHEKREGQIPLIGVMAEDSRMRKLSYLKGGCNAFSNKKPQSRPIMFWSEKDIWEYIKTKHLPYSKIYDMGYKRTGCMFCMFGVHMEQSPNRFQYMQKTHPKLWAYCIDKLNLKQVLDYIGIKYSWRDEFSMKQLDMFNDNNKEK